MFEPSSPGPSPVPERGPQGAPQRLDRPSPTHPPPSGRCPVREEREGGRRIIVFCFLFFVFWSSSHFCSLFGYPPGLKRGGREVFKNKKKKKKKLFFFGKKEKKEKKEKRKKKKRKKKKKKKNEKKMKRGEIDGKGGVCEGGVKTCSLFEL